MRVAHGLHRLALIAAVALAAPLTWLAEPVHAACD